MTRPDHDVELDQKLKSALHQRADALPFAPGLADGAISRARTIRRRRWVASWAAVVTVLAVTVPVGLVATDGSTQSASEPPAAGSVGGPARVVLDLDSLPGGSRPSVPFARYGVMLLAGGSGATDFQSLDWYRALAWGERAVVTELQDDGRGPRLYLYDNTSVQARAMLVEQGADSTVVSADYRWLAYVDAGEGGAAGTITVADAETGRSDVFEFADRSAELLAVVDGTVYFQTDSSGARLQSWSTADGLSDLPYDTAMVSDDGSLIATVSARTDTGNCHELVDSASDAARWETCDWTPAEVSPGGRWVYATPAYADGYGPTRVAVLDAETGQVVREVRLDSGERSIGVVRDAEWESENSLLLQVESGGEAALARLDVLTGGSEQAMAPVPFDGAENPVRPPYLLG